MGDQPRQIEPARPQQPRPDVHPAHDGGHLAEVGVAQVVGHPVPVPERHSPRGALVEADQHDLAAHPGDVPDQVDTALHSGDLEGDVGAPPTGDLLDGVGHRVLGRVDRPGGAERGG